MRAAGLLALFFVVAGSPCAADDCVDDPAVHGFRVRSVRPDVHFGRVPEALEQLLASHRGEVYSSESANLFANEIRRYRSEHPDPVEAEVVALQTVSISVDRWTPCTTMAAEAECLAAFGETRCVDVLVNNIGVQLDVYDVNGNRLPIPRSNKIRFFGE